MLNAYSTTPECIQFFYHNSEIYVCNIYCPDDNVVFKRHHNHHWWWFNLSYMLDCLVHTIGHSMGLVDNRINAIEWNPNDSSMSKKSKISTPTNLKLHQTLSQKAIQIVILKKGNTIGNDLIKIKIKRVAWNIANYDKNDREKSNLFKKMLIASGGLKFIAHRLVTSNLIYQPQTLKLVYFKIIKK